MQTLESLKRQIVGAGELESVVRTMKAMAASNIGQYEKAKESLGDYYQTIAIGLNAYFESNRTAPLNKLEYHRDHEQNDVTIYAIVFGSDQAFVGQFNDTLTHFAYQTLQSMGGKKIVWTVGTRIPLLANDYGLEVKKQFALPNSINAITSLIASILVSIEEVVEINNLSEFHIFHNQSTPASLYGPNSQRLLPLDQKWRLEFANHKWPTKKIPQLIGEKEAMIKTLIREYLFTTLYKACVESLVSENYSRLSAMQRAEKNIGQLLDDIGHTYHRLRQSTIDEELFDVVAGFEALKKDR